jgi:signal transduction histidine kinase
MFLGRGTQGPTYIFDRPARTLVVDDDPILREMAAVNLTMPGSSVVTAGDGEEAWAALSREGPFDLVLSDLEMPGLNGFGFLERVRGAGSPYAHLPVVVITSRDDMFAIDRAFELGATSFAVKPLNWRLLCHQLRYLVRSAALEAELRRAHEEARSAAALKTSLLRLVQHETRTPLHAVAGYAQILQRHAASAPDEGIRAAAAEVAGAATQLDTTLRRIFQLSQLAAGTAPPSLERVPLSAVVEETVRSVRAQAASAGVSIEIEPAPDSQLDCDLVQLSSALREILVNAIAASSAGSAVHVGTICDGTTLEIEVVDQGAGIPADKLEACRKPFGQGSDPLTRIEAGLGIGIEIAQQILAAHGGRLELDGAGARGTRARLILPLAAGLGISHAA